MSATSSNAPLVTVIIPHLNQPEFLKACLSSFPKSGEGKTPDYEILVVDNGSRVLPHDIIAQFPNARLLEEAEAGPGPARNKGVSEARGDFLAFTDSDCVIDQGWIARIAAHFSQTPDSHVVAGDVYILRADPMKPTDLEAYEGVYAFRTKMYVKKDGYSSTNNLAVRASTMKEVGGFAGKDIAEDRDWGKRAGAMGFETRWIDKMIVHHPARADFGELCKKWNRQTSHDYVTIHEGSNGRVKWLLRAGALAVSPLAEIPTILKAPRISGGRERLLAFWVLVKIRLYRAWIMLKMALNKNVVKKMSGAWNA